MRERKSQDRLATAVAQGLTLDQLERQYIERVLESEGGNKTRGFASRTGPQDPVRKLKSTRPRQARWRGRLRQEHGLERRAIDAGAQPC